MPIDNDVYDREGERWWDEGSLLSLLHGAMTDGRVRYFRGVLDRLGIDPVGLRTLDVGSGGGFLAEEFARLGCAVVGVDPSAVSLETARRHAAAGALQIDYRAGTGEQLPVEDHSFDVVLCCDVLEHVTDAPRVLREIARALSPGGVFLFDTVNRTWVSKVVAIKLAQEWRWTRLTDVAFHSWDRFITPRELGQALLDCGFELGEVVGLGARGNLGHLLLDLRRARRGAISYGELARGADIGQVSSLLLAYMGYARAGPRAGARRPVGAG